MTRWLALLAALTCVPAAAATPGDCLEGLPSDLAPASAQPILLSLEQAGSTPVLRATGSIDIGAAARLDAMLAHVRVDEVWLDSPGGDHAEALSIGRLLRQSGIATRIPAQASCAGACAEAFLGGIARFVDQGGRIGFTAIPLSDAGSPQTQAEREQAAGRWAEAQADYYIRAGVSRGLLRLQLDTPAPGICWLSETGLRRYNIVNRAFPDADAGR